MKTAGRGECNENAFTDQTQDNKPSAGSSPFPDCDPRVSDNYSCLRNRKYHILSFQCGNKTHNLQLLHGVETASLLAIAETRFRTVEVQQLLTDASLTGDHEAIAEAEKAATGFHQSLQELESALNKE